MVSGSDIQVQNAFSRASIRYDVLAGLHREIGRELTRKLRESKKDFRTILDVGMGTGWFTNRLARVFPEAKVTGLDYAPGMIEQAARQEGPFEIILADISEPPFADGSFDLVTSNLAFQWMMPVTQAFGQCRRILSDQGVMCGTLFGRETFRELFAVLEKEAGPSARIQRLPDVEEIKKGLQQAGFKDISVDYERIKVRYENLMDLLQWVKGVGANRLERNFYVGKDSLQRLCDIYDATYCDHLGVYATLEVIWFECRK